MEEIAIAVANLSHQAEKDRYFIYQSKIHNLVLCPEKTAFNFPPHYRFLMMGDCYPLFWENPNLLPNHTYFCNAPLGLGFKLMPTVYDLRLMDSLEDSRNLYRTTPWEKKSTIVYWRGSTTGTNYVETNDRVAIYEKTKDDENYDFKFTNFSNPESWSEWCAGVELAKRVSPEIIYSHKYLISADGNAAPWGFINDMLSNSLILKVESEFVTWYSDIFQPFKDYLPVSRDLSNLEEMRRYAIENDKTCKDMAENSSVKAYDLIKSIPRVLNEIQGE